ncbi:response regulator transcription factor [Deltaproteobacteria bacterium OttesenSCG-928-K17]|nr:response regulator transcription factor [Deltaproteobacteria bacterium OttesenSCG-928-K17]
MKKVLIVDDDLELCGLLSNYLNREGFECSCAYDGQSGLENALSKSSDFDLVILDVMLPLKNGFEVLSALRAVNQTLPVIMLTAKGEPVDRVVGLEMGADDYLPKPFDPRELLARIRSLARRLTVERTKTDSGLLKVGALVLNENSFQADFDGRPLNLTPVEFKVLWFLALEAGKIVSRDVLFREALGRREQAFDRSLDMHISRVRKKIWSDDEGLKKIKNVRGEGYIYAP